MPLPRWTDRIARRVLPAPVRDALWRRRAVRRLRAFRVEDDADLRVARHLVAAGDVVVDVGASIGTCTKALSAWVGARGSVLAVEPVPERHDALQAGVARLELRNVGLVRAAFSNRSGRGIMEISRFDEDGRSSARLVGTVAVHHAFRLVEVPTRRMDEDLLPLAGRITFVRCDVGGHELEVVEGAARILDVARPAWLVELADDPDTPGSPAEQLMRTMWRYGYAPWRRERDALRPRQAGDRGAPYFFLTDAHLQRLRLEAPALLAAQPSGVT